MISPCEFYFQFLEGEFKNEQDHARVQITYIERQLKLIASKTQKIQHPQVGEVKMHEKLFFHPSDVLLLDRNNLNDQMESMGSW